MADCSYRNALGFYEDAGSIDDSKNMTSAAKAGSQGPNFGTAEAVPLSKTVFSNLGGVNMRRVEQLSFPPFAQNAKEGAPELFVGV